MNTLKIILGSSSKFRQRVFAKITPTFESLSPDIDEKTIRDEDPKTLTRMIAHAKADALLPKIHEPAVLVTADQIVVVNGHVREKPRDEEECRAFLHSYNDQPVEVVNGIVATHTQTGMRAEGNDVVRIQFKHIPEAVIEQLILEGDVMHCAGGLRAEHPALQNSIASMDGTVESLRGVPLELTKRLIKQVES